MVQNAENVFHPENLVQYRDSYDLIGSEME